MNKELLEKNGYKVSKIIRSSKVESIRLEIMSQYILDENPDIVDFYTMSQFMINN